MSDYNQHITDKEIRELLKQRLLEAHENDPLTQKLIDMEAIYVFGTEAQVTPSLEREQEMLKKLGRQSWKTWLKWIIPSLGIACVAIVLYVIYSDHNTPVTTFSSERAIEGSEVIAEKDLPEVPHTSPPVTGDPRTVPALAPVDADTAQRDLRDKLPPEDPRNYTGNLKGNTKLQPADEPGSPVENIPSLSKRQIEENNKLKTKMIKQVLKKDVKQWVLVPNSQDVYMGDTISVPAFYISTIEVTNKQYRVFLNDLLVQGRADDYLKAIPDTAQWASLTGEYFEPMIKNYFWHPSYDGYPVVNVSRAGAELYCKWLTESVNAKVNEENTRSKRSPAQIDAIRLPYDVEWVVAARAGKKRIEYPWGGPNIQNAKGCFLANFNIKKSEGQLKAVEECYIKYANAFTSAGTILGEGWSIAGASTYNPNDYGIYNMSGNAAEMVWVKKTGQAGTKGGSWNSDNKQLKIEAQDEFAGVTKPSPMIGFRPVFGHRK